MTESWRDIGLIKDLDAQGRGAFVLGDTPIGVFRTKSGVFAADDRCPHGLGKLSSGHLDGDTVECPLHNACFALASGKCLFGGEWVLKTYPTRIKKGRIQIYGDVAPLSRGNETSITLNEGGLV